MIFHVISSYRGTEMLFTQVPQAGRSTAGKGTSYLKLKPMLLTTIRLLEPGSQNFAKVIVKSYT